MMKKILNNFLYKIQNHYILLNNDNNSWTLNSLKNKSLIMPLIYELNY
ncbi:hypothetical protein S100390_v1c04820 [Spiroplasma sp. NBRC 100390]|nr:hypothetical protein STU14_v1c04820 [Spiroplasma sp. TU-14]APE13295.1 hypothetical protein S100390_v1c04820 [Spiroplasma sp. NBRC 100390]